MREPPRSGRASGKPAEGRGLVGQLWDGRACCIAFAGLDVQWQVVGAGEHCWKVGDFDRERLLPRCMGLGDRGPSGAPIGLKSLQCLPLSDSHIF